MMKIREFALMSRGFMTDPFSKIIAVVALGVSALTMWLTLLRKGHIRMTQPTTFFFGPDGPKGHPKVYLRTLFYSTGKRGQIVESMFVKLRRHESVQTFNIWVYGDDRLVRGSGIYVGYEGMTCNHHFLLPKDGTGYEFLPGDYTVEIYAALLHSKPKLLSEYHLALSEQQSETIRKKGIGVFFDWGPDSSKYHAHIDDRPVKSPDDLPRFVV
jgi:hypothetical protein